VQNSGTCKPGEHNVNSNWRQQNDVVLAIVANFKECKHDQYQLQNESEDHMHHDIDSFRFEDFDNSLLAEEILPFLLILKLGHTLKVVILI